MNLYYYNVFKPILKDRKHGIKYTTINNGDNKYNVLLDFPNR